MKSKEKNKIIRWAKTLSNEKLENEYYNAVYDSLGSQTEDMYEIGYDIQDIIEQENYEKYLGEKADLLGWLCEERGIELWKYIDDETSV